MARELAPVGLRSSPMLFKQRAGAATRPSGSKLPRHIRLPLCLEHKQKCPGPFGTGHFLTVTQPELRGSCYHLGCCSDVQSLDVAIQAALMTSGFVLVDDAFIGHTVDNRHSHVGAGLPAMRACQPPYSLLTQRNRGQARSHISISAPKLLDANKNAPDLSVRGIS